MNIRERADGACELCNTPGKVSAYLVPPKSEETIDNQVAICNVCSDAIAYPESNAQHWRCLGDSIWNPTASIQVLSYQLLETIAPTHNWAQDIIDNAYLEDDSSQWIESWRIVNPADIIHKDCNGNILQAGDTVTLIKDLDVKGASFNAKRGTAVRNIRLVLDNPDQIEGKVNDQHIVILTQYVKKS